MEHDKQPHTAPAVAPAYVHACYRPSGKISRHAILVASACGLAVLPGAFFYAWVTMFAPALVNLFALMAFAVWIALVVDWAACQARVRDAGWITLFGVGLALAAWYCQWAVWIALAMQRQQGSVLLRSAARLAGHPEALLAAAIEVARHNAWGLGTMPTIGVWLVEAYVLLHFAPGLGQQRTTQPYCEVSDEWAARVPVPRKFARVADPAAAARMLERAPGQLLSVLAPFAGPDGADYTELTLFACRGSDSYVSISTVVTASRNDALTCSAHAWMTALRLPGIGPDALMAQLLARADACPAVPLPAEAAAAAWPPDRVTC